MGSTPEQAPLIVIVGQTASGKTAAAVELALKIDGEIICGDSRTVYKGMDIGTAKPTEVEQKNVPHHLIDQVFPDEKFTASDFKWLANTKITEIWARNHMPIMVGGTGLYIDSVLYDFEFGKVDEALRTKLESMTTQDIVAYATTNNISISGIEPGNKRHLTRAVERGGVQIQNRQLRANNVVLGLQLSKQELQQRIEHRVDQMFNDGFLKEAKGLFERYDKNTEALLTPGYRAAYRLLQGEVSKGEAKALFIKADLQLAKRQMTWFKRDKDIQWFDNPGDLIETAASFAKTHKKK